MIAERVRRRAIGTVGEPAAAGRRAAARPRGVAWPAVAVPAALYALAAALLAVPGLGHPRFAYNWEPYTAWRVLAGWLGPGRPRPAEVFALTDGLMTDSGQGPLVGLPVRLGFALAGVGVAPMRVPVALLAATAVPLLWAVGRRLAGERAATLAALLLAISPAFLFYGRSATLVGVSLAPALLTVWALLAVLRGRGGRRDAAWLAALQALLVAGAYAYAPIRLLWPLTLGLLLLELAGGRGRRRWLLAATVVTLLALPAALLAITAATEPGATLDPRAVVAGYYRARGEQLLALRDDPAGYRYYLRPTAAEQAAGGVQGSPEELARRLVRQNAGDLLRLLLDRGTRPLVTDHWNARGRLFPALLAPFVLIGLARALWLGLARWRHRTEGRVLAGLVLGFTLPLLLTSRVHVGRLVFAVPFLLLLAAVGAFWVGERLGGWLDRVANRSARGRTPGWRRSLPLALAAVLVVAVGRSAWDEARLGRELPPTREARVAAALAGWALEAARRGGAALVVDPAVGAEVEAVTVAAYRLELDNRYRFVALGGADGVPAADGDPRPALLYGGVLDRLEPSGLPHFCGALYLVMPEVEARFLAATAGGRPAGCGAALRYEVLPG